MSGPDTSNKRHNNEFLDEAVGRALSDNLVPLKRTVEDLQKAFSDLVAQCDSNRGSAALPTMLRAQSSAASLAAGLGVLSSFVAMILQPRDRVSMGPAVLDASEAQAEPSAARAPVQQHVAPEAKAPAAKPAAREQSSLDQATPQANSDHAGHSSTTSPTLASPAPAAHVEPATAFSVEGLPTDQQELHRRAKRVAKVAMQDIKMLKPKDVRQARENKEICVRLRDDLDKARKEYDRRFKSILDHPIDYFHDSMVAILADGDAEALGTYPYPSPAMRH